MAYAKFDDQDTGGKVYAKGDEEALRMLYDEYLKDCRASMTFMILKQKPRHVDLSETENVTMDNFDKAYEMFSENDDPEQRFFIDVGEDY